MAHKQLISLLAEVYTAENTKQQVGTSEMCDEGQEMAQDVEAVGEMRSKAYTRYKILLDMLRQKNYWPTIQMKSFYGNSGLVLLYNSRKTIDLENVGEAGEGGSIYKDCRSVVVNLGANTPEDSIVTSASGEIPVRVSDSVYESTREFGDRMETGFEGTTVYVYHHNGRWYFSTTTCPSLDTSRYFHPTKTHGMMFDEFLQKTFSCNNSNIVNEDVDMVCDDDIVNIGVETETTRASLRERFTNYLDTSKSYTFVLVHHENKHIVDYSSVFGESYKELIHISTQTKGMEEAIDHQPLFNIGVKYARKFERAEDAIGWLRSAPTSYAIIVKKENGSILKVCRNDTIFQEETDLGNANPWHNMLWIFLQNRPDFTVANYAKGKQFKQVKLENGKTLSPTFVIYTAVSTITSYMYNLYYATTYYNLTTREMIFKGKMDKLQAPIMRFHLVQLRNIQKKFHPDKLLSFKMISDYLRYHQTMKNIRLLIQHFTKNPIENINPEHQFCIASLNEFLRDH